MYKPTGFLAKQYSVTNETIQNWIKEGKFDKVKKTKGGHYRVWVDEPTVTILYARVSSSKQITSLDKQEQLLKDKYPEATFISDIASGFNQDRRGYKNPYPFWNQLSTALHNML
ncbi:MAG: recombinase family protein [Candidatus Marithrix sp.]